MTVNEYLNSLLSKLFLCTKSGFACLSSSQEFARYDTYQMDQLQTVICLVSKRGYFPKPEHAIIFKNKVGSLAHEIKKSQSFLSDQGMQNIMCFSWRNFEHKRMPFLSYAAIQWKRRGGTYITCMLQGPSRDTYLVLWPPQIVARYQILATHNVSKNKTKLILVSDHNSILNAWIEVCSYRMPRSVCLRI